MAASQSVAVRAIELCELQGSASAPARSHNVVAISDDHPSLAAAIARELEQSGAPEVQVSATPSVNTEQLIITSVNAEGSACDVHWAVLERAAAFRRAGGQSLVLLQNTGGCFNGGPSSGWHGGMSALARTAALEWPDMQVRCIDIAVDSTDLQMTARRVLTGLSANHDVVGVDSSGRVFTPQAVRSVSTPISKPALPIAQTQTENVWLVSGGARGVTAACVEALAQRTTGRFALLGRSAESAWPAGIEPTTDLTVLRQQLAMQAMQASERPVPKVIDQRARQALAGQEIRHTLAMLEAAGVQARYYPCDIADQQQVQTVLSLIQNELGQVTSLIHGAGVLADSNLVDKSRAEFDRVFDTKVGGLQNILIALGEQPLSHVGLFSSAAAFYGNTGQSDYAMANEVLNRVAHTLKQRWPQAIVKSFNWGPWDSGMVDQTLARYFEQRGISLIPVEEGAALFAEHMRSDDADTIELLVGDAWAE